jgi:hypothetical protein
VTGLYGTGNIGSPYWTFEPELIVSYLKDGWNLSAALYEELNTKNSISQYTTGDIIHADFTATKTIGKWTFGPSPIITDKLPTTRAVSAVFTERERWRIHKDSTSGRLVVSSGTIRTRSIIRVGNTGSFSQGFQSGGCRGDRGRLVSGTAGYDGTCNT